MSLLTPTLAEICRRFMEALLNPYFWVCLLFFILAFRILRSDQHKMYKRLSWTGVGLLILISTMWLPSRLIHQLENQYPSVQKIDPTVHWVVILSGGVFEDKKTSSYEALSEVTIKRLLAGIHLYKALPQAKLILSGGSTKQIEESASVRMGELVDWFNIPKSDQILESKSINTADEAKYVKEILGKERFYLVTSAAHMPRSMYLFKQIGLNPIPAPCNYIYYWGKKRQIANYIPNVFNAAYATIAWHELLGLTWGRIYEYLSRLRIR